MCAATSCRFNLALKSKQMKFLCIFKLLSNVRKCLLVLLDVINSIFDDLSLKSTRQGCSITNIATEKMSALVIKFEILAGACLIFQRQNVKN